MYENIVVVFGVSYHAVSTIDMHAFVDVRMQKSNVAGSSSSSALLRELEDAMSKGFVRRSTLFERFRLFHAPTAFSCDTSTRRAMRRRKRRAR
jgi:hypothetical protein